MSVTTCRTSTGVLPPMGSPRGGDSDRDVTKVPGGESGVVAPGHSWALGMVQPEALRLGGFCFGMLTG